jgi:hypothetical protein
MNKVLEEILEGQEEQEQEESCRVVIEHFYKCNTDIILIGINQHPFPVNYTNLINTSLLFRTIYQGTKEVPKVLYTNFDIKYNDLNFHQFWLWINNVSKINDVYCKSYIDYFNLFEYLIYLQLTTYFGNNIFIYYIDNLHTQLKAAIKKNIIGDVTYYTYPKLSGLRNIIDKFPTDFKYFKDSICRRITDIKGINWLKTFWNFICIDEFKPQEIVKNFVQQYRFQHDYFIDKYENNILITSTKGTKDYFLKNIDRNNEKHPEHLNYILFILEYGTNLQK